MVNGKPSDNGKMATNGHHHHYNHIASMLRQNGDHSSNSSNSSSHSHSQFSDYENDRSNRRKSGGSSSLQEHVVYIQEMTKHPWKDKANWTFAMIASALALTLGLAALALNASSEWNHRSTGGNNNRYNTQPTFDELGRYVIEDYDSKPPFSDFLPGLAGVYGKPLYAFIVNRGQGIASFGVTSKDYPILEYNSANKAYQNTPQVGFRTFIQGQRGENGPKFLVEPFTPLKTRYPHHNPQQQQKSYYYPKRIMYTGENELQIQEIDIQNHMDVNVSYFILPEEDFGAFVRRTTIRNTHKHKSLTISMLDGLAKMEPAGGKLNMFLKNMGRTLEGWMGVYFPYKDSISMPYFRLTTEPADRAFVKIQQRGHYCISMLEGDISSSGEPTNPTRLLPIVYDTSKVFGDDTTLLQPVELYSKSVQDIVNGPQYGVAKTSSCFAARKFCCCCFCDVKIMNFLLIPLLTRKFYLAI